MKNYSQITQDEMRSLINKSCINLDTKLDNYGFHKSLLKFFFGAVDVTIDYSKNTIFLWSSKPKSDRVTELYFRNEAFAEKVNYLNLEETLKGCLEDGDAANRFYRNLLFYYNFLAKESDALSA